MEQLQRTFLEQALDHRSLMFVQLPNIDLERWP